MVAGSGIIGDSFDLAEAVCVEEELVGVEGVGGMGFGDCDSGILCRRHFFVGSATAAIHEYRRQLDRSLATTVRCLSITAAANGTSIAVA